MDDRGSEGAAAADQPPSQPLGARLLVSIRAAAKHPGLRLLVAFNVLALATFAVWQVADRNQVTGDEGHYLVVASGIVEHGTLEQSEPYEAEFASQRISEFPFAAPGTEATEENTHGVDGPNGLFNVHGIGLPAVVAVPFWLAGPLGAKVLLVLLASIAVWCCWTVSGWLLDDRRQRAAAVAVVAFGLPLMPAANQIYPEVPGGVIALGAITRLWWRQSSDEHASTPFSRLDATVLAGLAVLPWLHIKFAPVAVVLVMALAWFGWSKSGQPIARRLGFVAPIALSGLLLAGYNSYAFGALTGPYEGGSVVVNGQSLTVLAGLYLDQFQGMLWQNLALFVALPFVAGFVRRFPVVGGLIIVVHLLFVVPNAMHVNWFGGFSFTGRFGWGGAIVAMPIAIYAISRLFDLLPHWWAVGTVTAMGALQVRNYVIVTFTEIDFYNRFEFPGSYPSLAPLPRTLTPILVDSSFAARYGPNLVFGLLAIALVVGGWRAGAVTKPGTVRAAPRVAAALVAGGIMTVAIVAIVAIGVASTFPGRQAVYAGGDLQTVVGERVDRSIEARADTAELGVVTFGPYIGLDPGRYRFVLSYVAENTDDAPIGTWDVVSSAQPEPLLAGPLESTSSMLVVDVDVTDDTDGDFQIRTLWNGEGSLRVDELTVDRI